MGSHPPSAQPQAVVAGSEGQQRAPVSARGQVWQAQALANLQASEAQSTIRVSTTSGYDEHASPGKGGLEAAGAGTGAAAVQRDSAEVAAGSSCDRAAAAVPRLDGLLGDEGIRMEEVGVSQHGEPNAAPVLRGAVHEPALPLLPPQRPLLGPSELLPQSAAVDERDGLLREALVMKPRTIHDPVNKGLGLHGLGWIGRWVVDWDSFPGSMVWGCLIETQFPVPEHWGLQRLFSGVYQLRHPLSLCPPPFSSVCRCSPS